MRHSDRRHLLSDSADAGIGAGIRSDGERPADAGGPGSSAPTAGQKAAIIARSFLLQSVWNPKGMQSVGFCFAILPMARGLRGGGEGLRSFLLRHLSFFNTNPAMSSYVLGSVAAAEARGDVGSIEQMKKGLSGPLGMSGDALLWGAARPFAGLVAVLLLHFRMEWAPLALLGIYNVPHLFFRVRGVLAGVLRGPAAAGEVRGRGFRNATRLLRGAAAFTAGALVAMAAGSERGLEPWRLSVTLLFFALAYAAVRLRMPLTLVATGGAIGGVALLAMGLNGG